MKSVTIVSADDTLADALSTALFVMGPERAADFWRVHRAEFGAVWLDGRRAAVCNRGSDAHNRAGIQEVVS